MPKLIAVCFFLTACGSTVHAPSHVSIATPPPLDASARFKRALAAFTEHEARDDWTARDCTAVARAFDDTKLAVAAYDAGLALDRCGDHAGAFERFERAIALDPKMTTARVRLALAHYAADKDLGKAVEALNQIVVLTEFHDAPALVELAALQMKKQDTTSARENLGRALAIDEASMPALAHLARLYLDTGHAEMAALVASQAIDRNVPYAPLFNAAGLVQSKLGKPSLAARMFQRATEIDPKLFEAWMNLGNINLSYRGFARAEEAFHKAVALRGGDYDAHLGLALALRGQIGAEVTATEVEAVRAELVTCMRIDAARPEAYFNDGILAQEFDVKLAGRTLRALDHAKVRFAEFKARAAGKAAFADAVKRADERIEDADISRDFFH